MGTSVLLIFIAPLMAVYALFGNLFAFITGEKTEVILPYDEANGIVWEYDAQEDYYIELVEMRIEGDEQIFVFKDREKTEDVEAEGELMDLIFTDKNGNQKKFYACQDNGYRGPLIYEESECLVTEYTATAAYPFEKRYWKVNQERASVLVQPRSYESEVTFTIVYTPYKRLDMMLHQQTGFRPMFYYVNDSGSYSEYCSARYTVVDGSLVIEDELHWKPKPPTTETE